MSRCSSFIGKNKMIFFLRLPGKGFLYLLTGSRGKAGREAALLVFILLTTANVLSVDEYASAISLLLQFLKLGA